MTTPELLDGLIKIIQVVVAPVIVGIYNNQRRNNEELIQLRTILIGADGIRSRVRRLERKLERVTYTLAGMAGTTHSQQHNEDEEEDDES